MELLNEVVKLITENGVLVGVVVYLLWERTKFMETLTKTLTKLEETTTLIKDYFIYDDDNK